MPFIHFDCVAELEGPLGLSLRPLFPDEIETFPPGVSMIVIGFQPDKEGKPRELELGGVVQAGDALVALNGITPRRSNIVEVFRTSTRPVVLEFVRYSESLAAMLTASILPASGTKVCVPLLRNLVRRASRQQRADSLAVTGYRGICWMVILGVLGDDPARWKAEFKSHRDGYALHAADILKGTVDLDAHGGGGGQYDRALLEAQLSPDCKAIWESVERDVHRTFMLVPDEALEKYRNVLQRVLTVHAYLNRGVSYVQGMNEIAGGVLEVLHSAAVSPPYFQRHGVLDWDDMVNHIEADTFWLFSAIVCGPCRDGFVSDNDVCSSLIEEGGLRNTAVDLSMPSAGGGGLVARLSELQRRVRLAAPSVDKLVHQTWGLKPHVYAARWYSVLLRREYWADSKGSEWNPQLWDCMLAFTGGNDEKRPGPWDEDNADCLLDLCCAYVTLQRKALEECEDVNAGLMLLLSQRSMGSIDVRIPPPPVSDLIAEASRMRGVRQRTETHNEIKAGISRAVKGIFGSIARRASSMSATDEGPPPDPRLSTTSVARRPSLPPRPGVPGPDTSPVRASAPAVQTNPDHPDRRGAEGCPSKPTAAV
eukprot:m.62835 g.62835  ORF g.62835 m.62835 type:complete len:594 (+) comp9631_c0_seq2:348-2129(+)